jgi:hypothetical protein
VEVEKTVLPFDPANPPPPIVGALGAFLGPWAVGTTYGRGSAVSYHGSSYVSLQIMNVGNTPDTSPSWWALLAAAGANGANGTNGVTPQLRESGAYVQVSYDGGATWANLIPLADITGPAGPTGPSGTIGNSLPGGTVNDILYVAAGPVMGQFGGTAGQVLIFGAGGVPGAVTLSGPISISAAGVTAIAATPVTAGVYPTLGQVPTFTVGADGRITLAGSTPMTLPAGFLPGFIGGLKCSAAAGQVVTVTKGAARDSTDAVMLGLTSTWTKNVKNERVSGTGNGASDGTVSFVAGQTVHLFVIGQSLGASADLLTSASATAPTLPSGYVYFRRIASVPVITGPNLAAFTQFGDTFNLDLPVADVNGVANPGTGTVLRTMTVPHAVKVEWLGTAVLQWAAAADAPAALYLSDPDASSMVAGFPACTVEAYSSVAGTYLIGAPARCVTSTSGQVQTRLQTSGATTTLYMATTGWRDRRGQDGVP